MSGQPTDEELADMGLPPAAEIRRLWARGKTVRKLVIAAGWNPRNPNTPWMLLGELAERMIDAKPGTISGYSDPHLDADQTQPMIVKAPDTMPRYDVIYRDGNVLGIVYGVPGVAPVAPRVPEGAETVAVLYVPGQR